MSEVHASLHQPQKPSTAFGSTSGRIARKRWGDHLSHRYGIWSGMQHLQQKSDETFASDQKMDSKKPLTLICSNQTQIQEYTQGIETPIFKLLRKHLPGPYTFVFRASKIVPKMMLTPRSTVGFRWPDHPITLAIVEMLGHPILSSSLRISEDQLYDDPQEIHDHFKKRVDAVVDGGSIFAEHSTIIDFSQGDPILLRQGKGNSSWLE